MENEVLQTNQDKKKPFARFSEKGCSGRTLEAVLERNIRTTGAAGNRPLLSHIKDPGLPQGNGLPQCRKSCGKRYRSVLRLHQ